MLVESLEPAVQAHVRLGLLAARAAVAVSRLPRGNQIAASTVIVRRGLTVRQTDRLVQEVLSREGEDARADRLDALANDLKPGLRPARAARNEADGMVSDVARAREIAARLETRLLATPLSTFTPAAAELLRDALARLSPVLRALVEVIAAVVSRQDAA